MIATELQHQVINHVMASEGLQWLFLKKEAFGGMIVFNGLGFNFGQSLTASFPRFAWECIPGRFASVFAGHGRFKNQPHSNL